MELWVDGLAGAEHGVRTIQAIRPRLHQWSVRKYGSLTFRITQVLSGHGCFGRYLCRIGREETASCHGCGAEEDTAQHTLEVCTAWSNERRTLVTEIGGDLSLPSVIDAMLGIFLFVLNKKVGWIAKSLTMEQKRIKDVEKMNKEN
ncbi:uncharacterized protein LOC123723316 [Papilio machaon]|uniref:uncharacterized protein LOC123723316 n=1 Tax=Papilio machaon TaxID=76193 RepID=UPI001E663B7C|nr:uncharacterized protein LOC123723316 [Papilio machaon]